MADQTKEEFQAEMAKLGEWEVSITGRELGALLRTMIVVVRGVELLMSPEYLEGDRVDVAAATAYKAVGARELIRKVAARNSQEFPDHVAYQLPPELAAWLQRARVAHDAKEVGSN